MTAILDSRGIAEEFFGQVRQDVSRLPFIPRLATVLYRPAADTASVEYRDLIARDARRLGLAVASLEPRDERGLLRAIKKANADDSIHGIVVFYPLRCGLKDADVMDLVSPHKDAEGLHALNLGHLVKYRIFLDEPRGLKCVVPAAAKAVVKALQRHPEIPLRGAFAVVVNNSLRVGKPLSLMLENLGATVVKCYDLTRRGDLERCVRAADILVTAVPDEGFRLDPEWVKPGAAVLDLSHGGNIETPRLVDRATLITMPQNRLGKVTRAMIFVNLVYCARYKGVFY